MSAAKGSVPWNAGTGKGWTDPRGYRWRYVLENGRRRARREHRVLVEEHLGRRLEPWEVVHHRNGDPSDNSLANLEVKEFGAHTADHHMGSRHSYEARRTMEAFALLREELRHQRTINADLLAALKQLDEFQRTYERLAYDSMPGNSHYAGWLMRIVEAARTAIAKAEGQS